MVWLRNSPGGGRRGRGLGLALLLLGSAFAAPAVASGATITFTVQNPSAVLQAGVGVYHASGSPYTNGYGQVAISGLTPGQQIEFSRDTGTDPTCPNGAPEGSPGQAYIVPNPAPATATIILPNSNGSPSDPGLSNSERGLVGLINQARSQNGVPPVQISTVLSAVTDRYSNYLAQTGQLNHCAIGSPLSRMIDGGYPMPSHATYGEVAAQASSAYGAFNLLMGDTPHRTILLDGNSRVVGVGRVGSDFVLDFVPACVAACERAGLTGDLGDSSLADGDPSDGNPADTGASGPGASCADLSGKTRKTCFAKAIKKCKRKHGVKRKRCIKHVRKNAS